MMQGSKGRSPFDPFIGSASAVADNSNSIPIDISGIDIRDGDYGVLQIHSHNDDALATGWTLEQKSSSGAGIVSHTFYRSMLATDTTVTITGMGSAAETLAVVTVWRSPAGSFTTGLNSNVTPDADRADCPAFPISPTPATYPALAIAILGHGRGTGSTTWVGSTPSARYPANMNPAREDSYTGDVQPHMSIAWEVLESGTITPTAVTDTADTSFADWIVRTIVID